MIEERVRRDCQEETGEENAWPGRAVLVREALRQGGEHGHGGAVNHGGAESPHDPQERAGIGVQLQVVEDVLHQGEAGAEGEAVDRCVDHEPDPVGAQQEDHPEAFEEFLHHGRTVAPVRHRVQGEAVHDPGVETQGEERDQTPHGDAAQHAGEWHELEAVHEDEQHQESEDREDAHDQSAEMHCGLSGSVPATILPTCHGRTTSSPQAFPGLWFNRGMFRRLSLLVDLYELTMVAGYVRHGMEAKPAVFDLYFRINPFQGGYALFAGLEPALDYLEGLAFETEDLEYLRGLQLFDSDLLDYLRDFRFRGRVTAASEGEVVFANEPLLSIEASLAEAQLVETALLNLVNFQTLVATKAARIAGEAGEAAVMEFGARRAQGPDGALSAARAACIGGVRTTSNLLAGQAFGIPVAGTQAHSWIMAFPSEMDAFRAYAATFPDHCVLLVDTYDTL